MEFEPEEHNVQGEAREPVIASPGKEETLRTQLDEPRVAGHCLVVCPGWSSHTS